MNVSFDCRFCNFRVQAEKDFQQRNGRRKSGVDSKISKAAKGLGKLNYKFRIQLFSKD